MRSFVVICVSSSVHSGEGLVPLKVGSHEGKEGPAICQGRVQGSAVSDAAVTHTARSQH